MAAVSILTSLIVGMIVVMIVEKANAVRGVEELLTKPESKIPVYVIPTNEELAIARETARLTK